MIDLLSSHLQFIQVLVKEWIVSNLQVLDSALNELLLFSEWDAWLEELKSFCQYSEDDMHKFLGEYQAYRSISSGLASKAIRGQRERALPSV